jgi:PilZ domain-containing protein
VDIPIEVEAGSRPSCKHHEAHNLSMGGLSFDSGSEMAPGSIVELRIPFVEPAFETRAQVVWCSRKGMQYELGVRFLNPDDAFRARMVEQVCHIEEYRRNVLEAEGRALSAEEAANEWINHYADRFPGSGLEHFH